jgi:hypothetical protein
MNDDLIAKNEASLREMGRDLEAAGYTLLHDSAGRMRYNALASPYDENDEYDEEFDYNWVKLSVDNAYCKSGEENKEEGPEYKKQYGFEHLYTTKEEQEEVLALIKQGHGIGVQMTSDQDVFVRWSKWKEHLAHFKATVEWLKTRN